MPTAYDILRAQPFLAGLTDWQLERLARRAQRVMIHAGGRMCQEGEPADRLWLLDTGEVELRSTVDGKSVAVDRLGPGCVVGWSSVVPPYRWHFGAVATATTVAVSLDGTAVRELCDSDPMLGYQFTRALLTVLSRRLEAQQLSTQP